MSYIAKLHSTTSKIIIASISISFALSIIMLLQDNVINNDGVTYLITAEHIKNGDWRQALQVYYWPFYSWLIALFSSATTLSLEHSAYTLNTLFLCVTVTAFILLAKKIRNNNIFIIFSAIIILIYPSLNDYRSYVIRDHGYLAFYLLSIYFFIDYTKNKAWPSLQLWAICMLVASLFRLEGIIFLLLLPLVLFLDRSVSIKKRIAEFTNANIVLFIIITALFILIVFTGAGESILEKALKYPLDILREFFHRHYAEITEKAINLERYVLNKYSAKYSVYIIYSSLIFILIIKVIKTLTPINTVLAILAIYKLNWKKRNIVTYTIVWIIVINIILILFFIMKRHYLTGRFPLGMSIVVMLVIPFFLERVYNYIKDHGLKLYGKIAMVIAIIVLTYSTLDGIVITGTVSTPDGIVIAGTKKGYIKTAGKWYAKNIGHNQNYFSNSSIFSYYAGQITETKSHTEYNTENLVSIFQNKKWKKLDYLVIKIPRKDKELRRYIKRYIVSTPIKEFSNKRGDTIRIYKLD